MKKESTIHRLSDLQSSQCGVIVKVMGHGSFRKRITEMGFVRGKQVKVIKSAPMMDPIEYEIMGYHVALRCSEAALIEITPCSETIAQQQQDDHTATHGESLTIEGCPDTASRTASGQRINIALVGNPNSGKTSLFNALSGEHEHVGNYSGVTVDAKQATVQHGGYTFNLSDLPGTYSITEYTPEELYVRQHLLDNKPDVIINVIDSSNLERNLYLTTQLIDMNLRVVIALNMYDELEKSGAQLDYQALGQLIGIPIVPTVASRGTGIKQVLDRACLVFEDQDPVLRHVHINYSEDIENSIKILQSAIWQNGDLVANYSSRYLAIKLLEGDRSICDEIDRTIGHSEMCAKLLKISAEQGARLEKIYNDRIETVIAGAKYGFIAGALGETYTPAPGDKNLRAKRIDRLLTHRIWGLPIFLLFMWVMFQTTFSLGAIPAEWIETGVAWLGEWVRETMSPGPLRGLLVDGVIGGVGGVIVFLPNILILFFFISVMEDTGYMARTAFLMDRFMHRIGLHGKSFIPLLMGFGCNVPAIMATRTLESRKDRLLTMLIIPFMSCSARLPVYVLLISAFFPKNQGLILLSIYLIGVAAAIISSLLFKRLFFRESEASFVMELPPYRIPTGRSVVRHVWSKGSQYLSKMGSVILIASVLIWALGNYPRNDQEPENQQRNSYIGQIGRAIEPVISPLGFDWKIGVSILSGMAAKEIVVSTMAVLATPTQETISPTQDVDATIQEASAVLTPDFDNDEQDEQSSLIKSLRSEIHTSGARSGQAVYSPLVAYGMMIFILLYFPCVAAVTAIGKEAGWRWAAFSVVYTTALAWLAAFAMFQIGSMF